MPPTIPTTHTADQILDQLLVLRAQDGEGHALHQLITRWHARLAHRASALSDNHDDAAEVLQHALLAIVRGLSRLDDPAAFPGWAMRIVAHKAADLMRLRKRRRAHERPLPDAAAPQLIDPDSAHPAQRDDTDSLSPHRQPAAIRRAIDALPDNRRAILLLHYAHNLSIESIAHALDIPPGTAKSRLFHARKQLKQLLERSTP